MSEIVIKEEIKEEAEEIIVESYEDIDPVNTKLESWDSSGKKRKRDYTIFSCDQCDYTGPRIYIYVY